MAEQNCCDLLRRARLLAHELVAGEADDREAAVAVGLLQALEAFVLGREAALGGHVDEQQRLAGVVAQLGVVALEGVDGDVVESHGPTLPATGVGAPGPPRVAAVHAVVIREGQLFWEERDDPVPGDTELVVAVRAAGINSADLVQRAGFYPAPPGWPADIPGMELAGEVVAVGRQVLLFTPGDRVMAVVGGGAQATLAVVDEIHALAVPDTLPWPEAGGFPEAFYDRLRRSVPPGRAPDGRAGARERCGGRRRHGGRAARPQPPVRSVTATVRDQGRHEAVAALGAATRHRPGRRGRRTGPTTSCSSWSARPAWRRSCRSWPPGPESSSSASAGAVGWSSTSCS